MTTSAELLRMLLPDFDIFRLRFRYKCCSSGTLPRFCGTIIRSCLGKAVRELTCVTGFESCDSCEVWQNCTYHQLFISKPERRDLFYEDYRSYPHPYIIQPPSQCGYLEPGQTFEFTLLLIGNSIRNLPVWIQAARQAGINGLGRDRIRMELVEISDANLFEHTGQNVVTVNSFNEYREPPAPVNLASTVLKLLPDNQIQYIKLQIISPLRLVKDGQPIRQLTFPILFHAALRRLSMLSEMSCSQPWYPDFTAYLHAAEHVQILKNSTRWRDQSRYSASQQQRHKLGGINGDVVFYAPEINLFLPQLMAAAILHVGKATAFGNGRFELFYV